MTDFKTLKKEIYSLPMDVRIQLDILKHEVDDITGVLETVQPVPDSRLEQHIFDADAIVDAYLIPVYGSGVLNGHDLYFRGPVPAVNNVSSIKLRGIVLASTAITEQWTLTFTTDTAFDVDGNYSGAQGSGTIGSDFQTTNLDLEIKTVDWVGATANDGDIFLMGIYKSNPVVRIISTMLATSFVINAMYSLSESESPTWSKELYKRAMDLLKALIDAKSDASLVEKQFDDIAHEAVNYTIDEYGRDVTKYGEYTDDVLPFRF